MKKFRKKGSFKKYGLKAKSWMKGFKPRFKKSFSRVRKSRVFQKKYLGFTLPVFLLICGVLAYLFVEPFKAFVNNLIHKK